MWRLFKSELNYNKSLVYFMLCLIPAVMIATSMINYDNRWMIFWIILLILENWIIKRNNERREFLFTLLPIPAWQKGFLRMFFIAIICGAFLPIFQLLLFLTNDGKLIEWKYLIVIYFLILLSFSIYFIIRDLLLYFIRTNPHIRMTRERTRIVLKLSLLAFFIAGAIAFVLRPQSLIDFINLLIRINPFTGAYGIIKFCLFSLILAVLTICSYQKRKTSLE